MQANLHNFPFLILQKQFSSHPMSTKKHPVYTDGWSYKDGLTSYLDSTLDGQSFMFNNNAFLLTEINPDGTEMKLFSAHYREVSNNNAYGGSFLGSTICAFNSVVPG